MEHKMSVPFYEFRMRNLPQTWRFKVLRDASGSGAKNKYDWGDLTWARHVDLIPPLEIVIVRDGEYRDVSFANSTCVPVLSSRAAAVVRAQAEKDIELIPAKVQGVPDDFFVMNVLSEVKCLNETKTRYVQKWTEDSGQPHRVGEYRSIEGLVIYPELAVGHSMFRLWGYNTRLIVSASIKEAFEREGFTGVDFIDVCSPQPTLAEMAARRKKMREFYDRLLAPAVEMYGPVKNILRAIVGFDAGGPVATCVLSDAGEESMTAYVTCELAAREAQQPGGAGRFELLTVCDDRLWAGKVLSLVGQTSMNTALDDGHTVDLSPALKDPGMLDAVMLEKFSQSHIDGNDYCILRCVGISGHELAFARQAGIEALRQKLMAAGVYATTRCRRESVVS